MLENGYIKIDRKITKWCWYKNTNTFKLFLHLLLTANYEDVQFEDIIVHRGQRVASFSTLSAETGLTIKEVRVAINHLKKTNEVASLSTPKFTVFTINNYEKYQAGANKGANEGQAKGKRGANEGQQWNGIDGDFGADTESAVKQFQKNSKIDVDGIVGSDTWSKLLK